MKDANTQFQEKYEARINENSGQETSLDLKRVETTTSSRNLVSFINSYEVISPLETLLYILIESTKRFCSTAGEGKANKNDSGTIPQNP